MTLLEKPFWWPTGNAIATTRQWVRCAPGCYGIATNLLRHQLRQEERRYRVTVQAAGRAVEPMDGPDTRVAHRVDAERTVRSLAVALALLAPGDRDVLLLSCWAGAGRHRNRCRPRYPGRHRAVPAAPHPTVVTTAPHPTVVTDARA